MSAVRIAEFQIGDALRAVRRAALKAIASRTECSNLVEISEKSLGFILSLPVGEGTFNSMKVEFFPAPEVTSMIFCVDNQVEPDSISALVAFVNEINQLVHAELTRTTAPPPLPLPPKHIS